jgi:hypothetical protein
MVEAEGDLGSTLEDLRAYRKRDPGFEHAIAKVVDAEIAVEDDPAEGHIVPQASPRKQGRSRS